MVKRGEKLNEGEGHASLRVFKKTSREICALHDLGKKKTKGKK